MDINMFPIALVVVILGVLFAIGFPLGFAMGLAGSVGLIILLGSLSFPTIGTTLYGAFDNPVLLAMPLFIFMGEIVNYAGVGDRIYQGITPWIGRLPGGLFHSNIGSCAVFAAMSGSTSATVATIGLLSVPQLERRSYDIPLTLGSICGGGTLGTTIPPSIPLVIYGSMVGESIGKLFIGGVFPGLLTALLFMLYITIRVLLNPRLAPRLPKASKKEMFISFINLGPALVLIVAVLGSIYAGIATPTEAAVVGVAGACIVGVVYRSLNWQNFKKAVIRSTRTTCVIFTIMLGASILSQFLAFSRLPLRLTDYIVTMGFAPIVFLFLVCIIYLMLGCFIDGVSLMLLTIPILTPPLFALGYNPLWFGLVLVILLDVAANTPPVGMNLFIMKSIAPKYGFDTVIKGVFPFILIDILVLVLLCAFPLIVTWLPNSTL